MSSVALAWAWSQTLSSNEKFILISLADHADEWHSCFPSVGRLMQLTGMSERTVRTMIKKLEEKKLIKVEDRRRDNGTQASNRYYLAVQGATFAPGARAEKDEQGADSAPLEAKAKSSSTRKNTSSNSVRSSERLRAKAEEDALDPDKAVWGNEGGASAPEPKPRSGRTKLKTLSAGENLARDFAARARRARPGIPVETNRGALSGQFNRWMKESDFDAANIRGMMDRYFEDERLWDSYRPMWVDFLNKRAKLATLGQKEAQLREDQANRHNADYWTEVESESNQHDAAYWESV